MAMMNTKNICWFRKSSKNLALIVSRGILPRTVERYSITHRTRNGRAERTIKTRKRLLRPRKLLPKAIPIPFDTAFEGRPRRLLQIGDLLRRQPAPLMEHHGVFANPFHVRKQMRGENHMDSLAIPDVADQFQHLDPSLGVQTV